MVSAKDILLWTLVIGGTAGAIYYAYSIYSQEQLKQKSQYVTQATVSVVPITPPTSYTNPTEPVVTKTNVGSIVYTTSAPPYSTLHFGYTIGTLPFTITINLEWMGDYTVNVEIYPVLLIKGSQMYEFGNLYLARNYTYTPPIFIALPSKSILMAPYNYANVPINVNLMDYLQGTELLSILEALGYLLYVSIVLEVTFGFTVKINGTVVGTYTEDLVLSYTPGI